MVQCKQYLPSRRVGSEEMQIFLGMQVRHHHTERGIYVTTADYTAPATALARELDILLVDGPELVRLHESARTGRDEPALIGGSRAGPMLERIRQRGLIGFVLDG